VLVALVLQRRVHLLALVGQTQSLTQAHLLAAAGAVGTLPQHSYLHLLAVLAVGRQTHLMVLLETLLLHPQAKAIMAATVTTCLNTLAAVAAVRGLLAEMPLRTERVQEQVVMALPLALRELPSLTLAVVVAVVELG
jgi:hypothetical protein